MPIKKSDLLTVLATNKFPTGSFSYFEDQLEKALASGVLGHDVGFYLDRGEEGVVFHYKSGKVIKFLANDVTTADEYEQQFNQTLAKVKNSPHVVKVYEHGKIKLPDGDECFYYVMPKLRPLTPTVFSQINQLLRIPKRMRQEQAERASPELGELFKVADKLGFEDMSPTNVMQDHDGRLLLIDLESFS